jgi:RecJ-like exonuclease
MIKSKPCVFCEGDGCILCEIDGYSKDEVDEMENASNGLYRCPDCNGTGKYVGFMTVDSCSECDGAGWGTKKPNPKGT